MRKSVFAIVITFVLVLTMAFSTTFAFGASNPNVTIVNPVNGNTVYSSSLLVSVKIAAPSTVKVSVYQKQKPSTSDAASTPVAITSADWDKYVTDKAAGKETAKFTDKAIMTEEKATDNNLTFYTKKLEKVSIGVYVVKVDTLDAEKKAVYSQSALVHVKEKESEAGAHSKSEDQAGGSQFLQNLLKNIFGN